jgi:diguanylate cyclase (GGDEF)-like protein
MGFVIYEIVSLLITFFLFLDLRGSRALKSKKDGMTMLLVVTSFTFYLIFSFIVNLGKANLLTFSPNLSFIFNTLFDLSIVLFILLWNERIIRSLSKKGIYLIIIACEVALLLLYLFLLINYLYPTFNLNQTFQIFSFNYGLYLLFFYYILNGTVVLLRRFRLINRQTVLLLLFSHLIFIIGLTTYFLFDSNHLLTISSAFLLFGSHLFLQQIQLNTDTLTLVPNQNAFILKLDDLMRSKRHATLLVADIENFRQINEQYGIASGDIILKEFAQYLANLDSKGSIYRIMGNRFVLVLPIQKHNHLVRLVGSIKEKSATGWLVGSSIITFHTNIAIVEIPYHAFSKAKTLEIIEFTEPISK